MSVRVTVVGGGLAGAVAAVAAAEAGAEVTQVARAPGASALSYGGVDLLPRDPRCERPEQPLVEGLDEVLRQEPPQLYRVLGIGQRELEQAATFLLGALPGRPLEWKGLASPPFVLATEFGTLRTSDLPPSASAAGDLGELRDMRVGVLGLSAYPDLDPAFVTASLVEQLDAPDRFCALSLDLDVQAGRALPPVSLARHLDGEGGAALCAVLASMTEGLGLSHLMVPPLMGISGTRALLEDLGRATGTVVFEALAVDSPCPGLRWMSSLLTLGDRAGVQRIQGIAHSPERVETQLTGLWVTDLSGNSSWLEFDALVLATGDLLGGGVGWESWPEESLLGLPVTLGRGESGHPRPWERPLSLALGWHVEQEQAALGAGLTVGPRLQPLGRGGFPHFENVWACGALLAGHDAGARRGGSGLALVTGLRAGRQAARGSS